LAQLVWNAIDADASRVEVGHETNQLGGVERISVQDDGHGIAYHDVDRLFGQLGESHKSVGGYSPGGRPYRDSDGEGRYQAFSLGRHVTWHSVARDPDGDLLQYDIEGQLGALKTVRISDSSPADEGASPGVRVVIEDLTDTGREIQRVDTYPPLLSTCAPYLRAYEDLEIILNGEFLEYSAFAAAETEIAFRIPRPDGDGHSVQARLTIVEWQRQTPAHAELLWCSADGRIVAKDRAGLRAPVSFSAYLSSDYIGELHLSGALDLRELDGTAHALKTEAQERLRSHFLAVEAAQAAEVVRSLREEDVYPYIGEPAGAVEQAARQVFDICAYRINQYKPRFSGAPKEARELTYRLLKETLETKPDSVAKILREVLDLSEEAQEEFAELLERAPLSAIIDMAKLVTDRLDFLRGLRHILFDDDYRRILKERSQLHRIVASETWIFGEQYALIGDDERLRTVLRRHVNALGRSELVERVNASDLEGLDDIPDLCLWGSRSLGAPDELEHLFVELKRPRARINLDAIAQVERYASTVARSPEFDHEKTRFVFYVVSDEIAEEAEPKCNPSDRAYGHVEKGEQYDVWAKPWSAIIQEAEGRHRFLREGLETDLADEDSGMRYLQEKYAQYLPEVGSDSGGVTEGTQ
jgi:hypothetical protein